MFSLLEYFVSFTGRSRNMSTQDPRSYALTNGPIGYMSNGYMRPPTCGAETTNSSQPVWVMQSMANRRSLGSESDGAPDRCVYMNKPCGIWSCLISEITPK